MRGCGCLVTIALLCVSSAIGIGQDGLTGSHDAALQVEGSIGHEGHGLMRREAEADDGAEAGPNLMTPDGEKELAMMLSQSLATGGSGSTGRGQGKPFAAAFEQRQHQRLQQDAPAPQAGLARSHGDSGIAAAHLGPHEIVTTPRQQGWNLGPEHAAETPIKVNLDAQANSRVHRVLDEYVEAEGIEKSVEADTGEKEPLGKSKEQTLEEDREDEREWDKAIYTVLAFMAVVGAVAAFAWNKGYFKGTGGGADDKSDNNTQYEGEEYDNTAWDANAEQAQDPTAWAGAGDGTTEY